jgi:acetyltransferase-like isoleucine patch superfamily enzyme
MLTTTDESTAAVGRPAPRIVTDVPTYARRRLSVRHAQALARWAGLRRRFPTLDAPLFFVDRGAMIDIGRDTPVSIGRGVIMLQDVTALLYGPTTIGPGSFFNRGSYLSCLSGLTIGAGCLIGQYVCIHDEDHTFGEEFSATPLRDRPFWSSPIRIGDNVWIGAKATVARGVTIGDDSVVAANSVVVRDVPPHSLVAGAPARVIRTWAPEVQQ